MKLTGGGGPIVLDQRLQTLDLILPGGTTFGFDSFNWTLGSSTMVAITASGSAAHFLLPKTGGAKFKIAGLEVAGSPDFELSTSDGGSTKVSVELELPDIFQGAAGGSESAGAEAANDKAPAGAKGMTLNFKFIASNDKGVRFAFKASVSGGWLFGKVQLTKLSVGLDQGPPLAFDGTATIKFPGGLGGKFTLAVGLTGDGQQAFPLVNKLSLQASELAKPIGYGFFLQRLGGQFVRCVGSDKETGGLVSANAGVSLGPKLSVPPVFDGEPVSLDGTVTLSLCEPKSVQVKGEGKIVEVPVGDASAKYIWSKGRVELNGNLDLTIGGWGFVANIKNGFVDNPSKTWNVEATGQMRLPGFTGGVLDGDADVVLSSNGLAACFGKEGQRAGIAKHWGEDFNRFYLGCDVGPYRAGAAAARTTAAGQRFTVAPKERVAVVTLGGSAGPPKVSLRGPGGVRIDTPTGPAGLQSSRAIVVQDPAARTTYMVLFSPRPGTWTIAPEPLAVPPTSVRIADGLPPVQVSAKVRSAGGKEVLSWSLHRLPGQRVTFIETGRTTDRKLVSTTKARGRVRFVADVAAGRARKIEAFVTQLGLPRAQLIVARFRAAPPPRLRAVGRVRARRGTLSWPGQPAAVSYSLMLRTSAGVTLSRITRRPRFTVPRSMRRRRVTVWISALDPAGGVGPLESRSVLIR